MNILIIHLNASFSNLLKMFFSTRNNHKGLVLNLLFLRDNLNVPDPLCVMDKHNVKIPAKILSGNVSPCIRPAALLQLTLNIYLEKQTGLSL